MTSGLITVGPKQQQQQRQGASLQCVDEALLHCAAGTISMKRLPSLLMLVQNACMHNLRQTCCNRHV
jgi:hypothetical protein